MQNGKEKVGEKWPRRNFIVGICAIVVPCVVAVGLYLHGGAPSQEVGPQNEEAPSESSEPSSPRVEISSLRVSKVAMDIPEVFEMEVEVISVMNVAVARDFKVILDFGRAEIDVCDYTPKRAVTKAVAEDKRYWRLEILELRKNEELHIRCLISLPEFNQVIIEGGNLFGGDKAITFEQYRTNLRSKPNDSSILWVIAGYVLGVLLFLILCALLIRLLWSIMTSP